MSYKFNIGDRVRALGATSLVTTKAGDLGTILEMGEDYCMGFDVRIEWDEPQRLCTGTSGRKWFAMFNEIEPAVAPVKEQPVLADSWFDRTWSWLFG